MKHIEVRAHSQYAGNSTLEQIIENYRNAKGNTYTVPFLRRDRK